MKLGLFGATGNTGQVVAKLAISNGHEVTVLVRNKEKLSEELTSKLASIVEGDVLDLESVRKTIRGQDGIVIALGRGMDLSPTTVFSEGTKNILTAMKEAGIRRVSACLSGFLFFEADKLPERFRDITDDHQRMLEVLKSSDSDWVAVCPPHIADDPAKGEYEVVVDKRVGSRISKEDLADFLIKCLLNDEYLHKAVGIGYSN